MNEVNAEVRGNTGLITLNRPKALNALSLSMIRGLTGTLLAWEHDPSVRVVAIRGMGKESAFGAFCAGGDIRFFHQAALEGNPEIEDFFTEEYTLNHLIHAYPKPYVVFLDGIVMGGGMGISQGARLRIVGDRTRMAMPETAIGLFPDVGGSYFLSRTPGRLGVYLGLTGVTIGAADAIYCGLADAYIGAHEAPPPGELERLRPAIDRHFAAGSVEGIVASLAAERSPEHESWARETVAKLRQRSPTMLKVTLEQLTRAAQLSLAECFRMELGLIHGCFEQGDFAEGIRAVLVDKDQKPRWNPPAIAQVDAGNVRAFFRARWDAAAHPLAHLQ